MNYLEILATDEIKFVCASIPYKEVIIYFKNHSRDFSKLMPGFRVQSLNPEKVKNILYEKRNTMMIRTILNLYIEKWIKMIDMCLVKEDPDHESAYIKLMAESVFAENVGLYFKLKEEEKSEDYLKVLSSAVLFHKKNLKEIREKKEETTKRLDEMAAIQEKINKGIEEEEKKVEKAKRTEESLRKEISLLHEQISKEEEKSKILLCKIESLNSELQKAQEDELWKTSKMEQKIDSLTAKLEEKKKKEDSLQVMIQEYIDKLKVSEEDTRTWNNKVRILEKQLFQYKAEKGTLLTENETARKKLKELKNALDQALSVELAYKEQLEAINVEAIQNDKRNSLEETIEEQSDDENAAVTVAKKYSEPERKVPLCPDDMYDFDEFFTNNLEDLGLDVRDDGVYDFICYLQKIMFQGIPLLIKRGPGINLANCLSNTLYGVPEAVRLLYTNGTDVQIVRSFLQKTPDRVVCIDGFIGNCNLMELIPVLEEHRNKIIILTYMFDRTLRYIPNQILSYVNYINGDAFGSLLKIKDNITEPSELTESPVPFVYCKEADRRIQKIAYVIAEECGIDKDTALSMAENVRDENHLNESLMFSILPYVSNVFGKKPYNCSKRLQHYAGENGKCSKKSIILRWFG